MMKRSAIALLALIWISTGIQAQDYPLTDSLKRNLEQATTPAEKIRWLTELSFFYMNLNTALSNQYGEQQLEIAEISRDRKLMLLALLSNSQRHFFTNGLQQSIDKAGQFATRALTLARSSHLDDYTAWAYLYLGRVARANGEHDKALNYNTLAASMAASLDNDSLKVSALNSLGNTHLARNENLLAFRNFLQALNMAEDLHNYELLQNSYNNMSNFYVTLGEYEKAKDYLFKLQHITQEFRQPYDRLNVYRSIALVYAANKQLDIATRYYEKMIGLADTVKLEIYKLNAYFDITNQYLNSNQGARALAYFNAVPEMKRFLVNSGNDHYLFQVYASAHAAMQRYDSAEYYFKKAEQGFEARTSRANRFSFYSDYADYHADRSDYRQALVYWLKAQKIADDTKDLELQSDIAANLDTTYQKLGDYRNAYAHKARYHHFKDSLEKLSTEKDLLLLEVENENRRKEKELTAVEEARRERHNIQYMGITAGIAGVFIVLVMLGIFSVSKTTIRILGFFAFIFLFEFIILLADTEIHHLTHGEPWKILAIKIGLISILLPLHHFLEERVIHYLTSRKLLAANAKSLLQKFARKGEADPVLKH